MFWFSAQMIGYSIAEKLQLQAPREGRPGGVTDHFKMFWQDTQAHYSTTMQCQLKLSASSPVNWQLISVSFIQYCTGIEHLYLSRTSETMVSNSLRVLRTSMFLRITAQRMLNLIKNVTNSCTVLSSRGDISFYQSDRSVIVGLVPRLFFGKQRGKPIAKKGDVPYNFVARDRQVPCLIISGLCSYL